MGCVRDATEHEGEVKRIILSTVYVLYNVSAWQSALCNGIKKCRWHIRYILQ